MTQAQSWRQANISAVLFLGCTVLFTIYRWQYAPRTDAAAGLVTLTSMLKLDATHQPKLELSAARDGATVPELLSRVQEISTDDNIAIHSVTPSPVDPDLITIHADGGFRDLMRFMARLETFQVTLSSFDLVPGDQNKIAATIGITRNAKAGAPASFADYIDAISAYAALRDPFEIGDPVPLPNAGPDLGDLSWTYHLTSISLLGAERIATIDGRDYKAGDPFNGMTVAAIGPSGVTLASANRPIPQMLHFRHNPGAGDAKH